jgi:uncharacterized protein YndB with AHSA1/START domain
MTDHPIPGSQEGVQPRDKPGGAALDTIGGRPVLRLVRRLPHRPEKVWRVITEPDELAHWFPAVLEGERTAGAPVTFRFEGSPDAQHGTITEFAPPKVFAFTWGTDELRFELEPDGEGCVLRFSHVLGGGEVWSDRLGTARQAAGWDVCLAGLAGRLGGHDAEQPDWLELNQHYLEAFGIAAGEVREVPGGYVVRFERDLVRPAAAAWETLAGDAQAGADPPERAVNQYVQAGADLRERAVNQYLRAGPVTIAEPPEILEYASPSGRVHWRFTGNAAGCRLVLTHEVPAALAGELPAVLAAWHAHLERFVLALHGR